MRTLTILGSTGSIGTQTLDIVDEFPNQYKVKAISCHSDIKTLLQQIEKYKPDYAVVVNESAFENIIGEMNPNGKKIIENTQILTGKSALEFISSLEEVDTVVVAIVGNDALLPTLSAIESKKRICLANKEVLVTSGHIIMPKVRSLGVELIPVDSEHSAVFQSLQGSKNGEIEKVILTASGGPFRGRQRKELESVKAESALKHPNWEMGKKITIDSATLMNKGLEVIEAKWLFDLTPEQIDVVVHPQSIIHSMVQFKDSSVIAQLGLPDMRLPILYALTWPNRNESQLERMDLAQIATLTFEKPDRDNFPCLDLAYKAMTLGGIMPTILNAANEVLVERYLKGEIGFYDIPEGIEYAMSALQNINDPTLEMILKTDQAARAVARTYLKESHK